MTKVLPKELRHQIANGLVDAGYFKDLRIVDVGSLHRDSVIPLTHRSQMDLYTFDESSEESDDSEGFRSHTHFACLVGNFEGRKEFYLTRKAECSSLKKPNFDFIKYQKDPDRFDIEKVLQSEVHRLDTLLDGKVVDFLKIDCQGGELDILQGAEHTLDSTLAVLCEVSMLPVYQNSPMFYEVAKLMYEKGFVLIDSTIVSWNNSSSGDGALHDGVHIFSDFLFIRSEFLSLSNKSAEKVDFYRLIYILTMLGIPLAALECVNTSDVFSAEESKQLGEILTGPFSSEGSKPMGRRTREEFSDL